MVIFIIYKIKFDLENIIKILVTSFDVIFQQKQKFNRT